MRRKKKITDLIGSDGELLTPIPEEKRKQKPPRRNLPALALLVVLLLAAGISLALIMNARDSDDEAEAILPTSFVVPTHTLVSTTIAIGELPPSWTPFPTRTPTATRTPSPTQTPTATHTATPTATITPEVSIFEATVDARLPWQETVVEVQAGDLLEISYQAGRWRNRPDVDLFTADGGITTICNQSDCQEPLWPYPQGGLIGRVGQGTPFGIGNYTRIVIGESGLLQFRMNDLDEGLFDNSGNVIVQVKRSRPVPMSAPIELRVSAEADWQTSLIRVQEGELIEIEYVTGFWYSTPNDPDLDSSGIGSYQCNAACVEPVEGYPRGGLIGRLGDLIFPVGVNYTLRATSEGILDFRMNDWHVADNDGAVTIKITVK